MVAIIIQDKKSYNNKNILNEMNLSIKKRGSIGLIRKRGCC